MVHLEANRLRNENQRFSDGIKSCFREERKIPAASREQQMKADQVRSCPEHERNRVEQEPSRRHSPAPLRFYTEFPRDSRSARIPPEETPFSHSHRSTAIFHGIISNRHLRVSRKSMSKGSSLSIDEDGIVFRSLVQCRSISEKPPLHLSQAPAEPVRSCLFLPKPSLQRKSRS